MDAAKAALVAQLGVAYLEKKAQEEYAISPEDVARMLAGQGEYGAVSPEDVSEYSQQLGRAGGRYGAKSGLLAGGIGGAIPGALLGGLSGGPMGAAGGALAGGAALGGIGAGLGYLGGRRSGRQVGEFVGESTRRGELPSEIPEYIPTEALTAYTGPTDYEEEAVSMTPEEYEAMRSQMRQAYAKRHGLSGAGRGALYGTLLADEDPLAGAMTGAAVGGGLGAMGGAAEAAQEAGTIQDLQGRGYGHLAERLRSRAERGIF